MKIYILDFIPKINKTTNKSLDTLHKKVINYNDIYSTEGIFRIQNNVIYQLMPNDIPVEKFEHNCINFLLDKSKHIFRKDIYCIPYNHIVYNIQHIEYKLDPKSKIALVLEYSGGDPHTPHTLHNSGGDPHTLPTASGIATDIYFYTNEEDLNLNLKNNILEYFSLLTNIK